MSLNCFKAYDIRGVLGEEINSDIAYRIGRAFGQYFDARKVAVGADIRLSSDELKLALSNGLRDAGTDVIDLGVTGTEEIYFSAFNLDIDGAIQITASHNPINYNGMKLVGRSATPISGDTGLNAIRDLAASREFIKSPYRGGYVRLSLIDEYVKHLMSYIDLKKIKPMRLVVNSGNGAAGHVIDEIEIVFKEKNVPVEFIKIHHEPDGNFPNGIPNPLLPENRAATSDAVKSSGADMGIAWDGDFDRCFLFDENGSYIEGYYIVGLLTEAFLTSNPYSIEKIIHDPRLVWNTVSIANKFGGIPIQCKTGHAFIKERMREENAIYGGEMSSHHYFRDFSYCDSGMIPWLLVIGLLSEKKQKISELVGERIYAYPCSGELNYKVDNANEVVERVKSTFISEATLIENVDGLSMEMSDWRFNIRMSNTEPLLRLNIESRGDANIIQQRINEMEILIKGR